MKSRNLVICDTEEEYAKALGMFLARKKELKLQVHICSGPDRCSDLGERSEADILISAAEYVEQMQKRILAKKVFVLGSGRSEARALGYPALYKYQSGEGVFREILKECAEMFEAEDLPQNVSGQGKKKIIGIFSPVHRIGKTKYALELGERMAESENVLYLNLEFFAGIDGHFEKENQTLSDVLYYARQEKGNLGLMLTTLICHRGNLDYIQPMTVSEDLKEVQGPEWVSLFRKILEQSIYETLILDIDEGISGLYQILKNCTEIHMPVSKEEVSQAKIRQFEHEATILGHEDILKKIVRRGGME